jgi:hypothetical protein
MRASAVPLLLSSSAEVEMVTPRGNAFTVLDNRSGRRGTDRRAPQYPANKVRLSVESDEVRAWLFNTASDTT